MKSARLLILGVAVIAAGGAGYIAMNLSAPPPAPVVVAPETPQIQLEEVLVATENLGVGAELTSQMRWQSWPKEAISDGYITRSSEPDAINQLNGATVRLQLFPGEPIRKVKLIGPGQSFLSSILPPGMRAVATQINAESSAGGFILPNDFVDVIMTRRKPDNASSTSRARHRPDDSGRRARSQGHGRPDGDTGTDARSGGNHHRRPANGGPADTVAAIYARRRRQGHQASRLSGFLSDA
jgi:pilus assembly protein CpaB